MLRVGDDDVIGDVKGGFVEGFVLRHCVGLAVYDETFAIAQERA